MRRDGEARVSDTCNDCRHLKQKTEHGGHCFRYPPTPAVSRWWYDPYTGEMTPREWDQPRPWMALAEEACGEFAGALDHASDGGVDPQYVVDHVSIPNDGGGW